MRKTVEKKNRIRMRENVKIERDRERERENVEKKTYKGGGRE